jgi:hypothetical protein
MLESAVAPMPGKFGIMTSRVTNAQVHKYKPNMSRQISSSQSRERSLKKKKNTTAKPNRIKSTPQSCLQETPLPPTLKIPRSHNRIYLRAIHGDESECAPLSFLPIPAPPPHLGVRTINRRLITIGQSERKGKDQIRSSAWEGLRKYSFLVDCRNSSVKRN